MKYILQDLWDLLKIWGWVILAVFFFFWERNYEANTIAMSDRLEVLESRAETTDSYVQKLNCFAMYNPLTCEPDIEQDVVEMIKEHESFSAKGYKDGCVKRHGSTCVQYRYSIGYGTREKTRGEVITEEEATARLKEHLRTHVYPYVPAVVSDLGTFMAVVDLGYNAGPRAMKSVINFDGTLNIEAYQEWINANGKKSNGLERRRKSVLIYALAMGAEGE